MRGHGVMPVFGELVKVVNGTGSHFGWLFAFRKISGGQMWKKNSKKLFGHFLLVFPMHGHGVMPVFGELVKVVNGAGSHFGWLFGFRKFSGGQMW